MIDIDELEGELLREKEKNDFILRLLAEVRIARKLRKGLRMFDVKALAVITGDEAAAIGIYNMIRNYDKVRG